MVVVFFVVAAFFAGAFFAGAFFAGVFLAVVVLADAFLTGVFLVVVLAGAFLMAVFLAEAALLVDDLAFFVELLEGAAFLAAVIFFGAADVAAACLALAASLTFPLTPLGRRNTPLSLPRTMALFKCVLNDDSGSLPVSGCLARITFLSVGRPRPARPSSPYEMIASMIMSSYVMLDGFLVLVDFLAGALATADLALVGAILEEATRQCRDGGLKRTSRSWKTRSCLGRFPFHKSAHIWPCISRARKTTFSVHECAVGPISSQSRV